MDDSTDLARRRGQGRTRTKLRWSGSRAFLADDRLADHLPVLHALAHRRLAGEIAREEVDRLALVGPLPGAIVTGDDGPVGVRLGVGLGGEGWPETGAAAGAGRLAGGIVLKGVKRLAVPRSPTPVGLRKALRLSD